jgi:hypothetical protein
MGEAFAAEPKVLKIQMILMGVGYENAANICKSDSIMQHMTITVCREINQ